MNELYRKTARNFPDGRTIWTELRSRFIRASAVHTFGLHAPSVIPRPKPRNQGNEGQLEVHTHRKSTERAHTRSATETQHNSQPETQKGTWPLLLPRHRHRRRSCCCCCCCCCCCAATVQLLCCCCFTTRDASRSTSRLNRLFLALCFWNARRSE